MSETNHLALPLIAASQAQKHVTHNEALVLLDAAVQLAVISRGLAAPPASPAEGDRYLVAASPTGDWTGHAGALAFFQDGAWRFAVPRAGWRLWSIAEAKLLVFDGTAWAVPPVPGELQNLALLGVATTADAANKLAVASGNVLFTHAGSDQRLKLNKNAAGDTASVLLQNGFSGRAELGLAGDDDFHVKVSGDGAAWNDAVTIDRTSGRVGLPQGATLTAVNVPPAPASGKLELFAQDLASRALPAFRGAAGLDLPLQPFLGKARVSRWCPAGSNTTIGLDGCGPTIATGTATSRVCASTRYFTAMRRIGYVSAGAAGSSCGALSHNALVFWRGNAAGLGGFHAIFRFGVSDAAAVADARTFAGLAPTNAAIGNVNPSTLLNIVGAGCDNGQTTLRILTNDGAGAASVTDLGAAFPTNTLSTDMYELMLYAAPNGATIAWRVTRLNTGDTASGTLSADLPVNTQFLAPQVWRNNGATALAAGIDIAGIHVETDH